MAASSDCVVVALTEVIFSSLLVRFPPVCNTFLTDIGIIAAILPGFNNYQQVKPGVMVQLLLLILLILIDQF